MRTFPTRRAGRLAILALTLILTSLPGPALAQETAGSGPESIEGFVADLEAFVETTMERLGVPPGLAIAVVHGDRVVYRGGFGYLDAERRIPVQPDTPFYIASATKPFTGLAAAILAERGELDLDTPFTRYLPEAASEATAGVTMLELLTHTSGLESEPLTFRTAFSGQYTTEDLFGLVANSAVAEPGFRYDNYGYLVTSLVIDRIDPRGWREVLEEEVFGPLGMARTTCRVSEAAAWPVAAPYVAAPDGYERIPFLKTDATMHAAGGIVSTADDLARWLRAQLNEGRIDGRQILSASAVRSTHEKRVDADEEFWSFRRVGYGLGWYVGEYEGDTLLHHFGSFPGYRAHLSFLPDHDLGVVVLVNELGHGFFLPDVVATYAYDRWLGRPDLEARFEATVAGYTGQVEQRKSAMRAHLEERARRASTLSLPIGTYVGEYASPAMGTARIVERDGGLVLEVGGLSAPLEPFTEPETMRVELVPGVGKVVEFHLAADESVTGMAYYDHDWSRTGGPERGGTSRG